MRLNLLEWQEQALTKLKSTPKGGGLALWCDTGLGKGILGAYVAEAIKDTLIICPPHLIEDWKEKLTKEANELTKDNLVMDRGVNIISYNKFTKYSQDIYYREDKFFLILDEAHKVKNFKSKTTKSVVKLLPKTSGQLLLSASFVTKNNVDLFAPAYICNPDLREKYGSLWAFGRANIEYDKIYVHKRIIEQPKAIRPRAYKQWIKPIFFMASYETAKIERPEYTVVNVPVKGNSRLNRTIKAIEEEELLELSNGRELTSLTAVEYQALLRLIANPHSKYAQISNNLMYNIDGVATTFNYTAKIEKVKSIVDTEVGNRGLLFYYYKAELDKLKKAFPDAYFYDSRKNTQKQIEEFERSSKSLFIANYSALGEGVRFKKTHYIIEFTLIYDYAKILQARGRLQYVGRMDTYKIYHMQLKHQVVKAIVDNIGNKIMTVEESRSLLEA